MIVIMLISGYILGSIPSAYLFGRIRGIDLMKEGDGHISATAVYRRFGIIPIVLVILTDAGKAVLAIYIARVISDSGLALVLTAIAVIIGHCWSLFLGFKGGMGAVVAFTTLGILAPMEFFIAGTVAGVFSFVTRRSGLGTYAMMVVATIIFVIEEREIAFVTFPAVIVLLQLLKRLQIRKYGLASPYENNLFKDLKRVRKSPHYPTTTSEAGNISREVLKTESKNDVSLPTYSSGDTK